MRAIAFDSSDVLYASSTSGELYTVDLDTGYTYIGDTGHELLSGLAFDPVDNTLWGSELKEIYKINPATAAVTLIGESDAFLMTDLDFDPDGNLFACHGGASRCFLVSINKTNGESYDIGEIGFQSVSGLAFYKLPLETRTISVTPNIELEYTEVDSSSSTTVTIGSIGTRSLTITDISDPGEPFSLTNLPDLPLVLLPDSTATFDVTFSPADTGRFNSTFSIISNDDENPEFDITVNARGFTIHTAEPGACYSALGAYDSDGLLRIDLESGAGTLIGETVVSHLAINSTGEMYGAGPHNNTYPNAIYVVDALSGGSRFFLYPEIGPIYSMVFDQNDLLFVLADRHLYSIDLPSGTVNDIGFVPLGIFGEQIKCLSFDPVTGTLWATENQYYIFTYTIDPLTAEVTWHGETETYYIYGLGSDIAGNLYAVSSGSSGSGLYSINKITGRASFIGYIGFPYVYDLAFFNVPVEGKHLSVTSRTIDFGSIDVDGSRSKPVTIGNFGTEDLTISDISVPDAPFSVDQITPPPITIPPFTSHIFKITFAPKDSGSFNGHITVSSDDEDNTSLDITLEGDGFVLHAAEDEGLYSATGPNYGSQLTLIDPATGEATLVVHIGVNGFVIGDIGALAVDSTGIIYVANDRGFIYKIDAAVHNTAVVFTSNMNIILQGMAFNNNDVLFGTDGENLYLIDPQEGFYNIGPAATGTIMNDISFDPTDNTLWGSDADNIYTIDTLTAVATLIGSTQYSDITGLSFDMQGNLYAVQHLPYSATDRLISINKSTGEGTLIGNIGFDWWIENLAFNRIKNVSALFDTKNNIPMVYALKQNYPNPFNTSTTIAYDLPVTGNVELIVYDILGKKVATLVNGYQTAGKHSVQWDAGGQSSGLYFYQIKAGNFLSIKKCIFLK